MTPEELQMVEFYGPETRAKIENIKLGFEIPLSRRGVFFIHKKTVDEYGWQFNAVCDHRNYEVKPVKGEYSDHLKISI